MGYRVENYNLDELNRIAEPGSVAPSLFWVLPVGNWEPKELDRLWHLFTKDKNMCSDYGSLLVKEAAHPTQETSRLDLAQLGAKLKDVMPVGAERFARPSAFSDDSRRLLVLSGGYPQPGWGVLIEWLEDAFMFDQLISSVNRGLASHEHFAEGLRVFMEATEKFHSLRSLGNPPPAPDVSTWDREIHDAEKCDGSLQNAQDALERGCHRLASEKIAASMRAVEKAMWLQIPVKILAGLQDNQRALTTAVSIIAVPADLLATQVEPKLDALIVEPKGRGKAFRSLSTEELKSAMTACLRLRGDGIVKSGESFQSWAQLSLAKVLLRLKSDLPEIRGHIARKLELHRGAKAQREREHELAMESLRRNSGATRAAFHDAVGRATHFQWDLGPLFLVALEDTCREQKYWARSVPWDPARMVGWKIMVRQANLDIRDLQEAAREFSPGTLDDIHGNAQQTGSVDGSYFTDYVHHIAMSKPSSSPRAITSDLVSHLLRPAEMIRLLQLQGLDNPDAESRDELADLLIEYLGWRKSGETREKPLAGCIATGADGIWKLDDAISANDVRVVLESFCKDVIDVVVAQLGYKHSELWDVIGERLPEYRPSSRRRDWNEEVGQLTVGPAVLLLSALGSLAFQGRATEVEDLVSSLRELSELLNRASHHQGEGTPAADITRTPVLIRKVIDSARRLLGECPWHLQVSLVYGEQPKVVSGEAWSHGSATTRMLKVILWTGYPIGRQALLWDKTRRNPIIADPVFINRPRPTGGTP